MNESQKPLVAVIMGSKSDWDTMRHADETLSQFGVPHECRVMSAHRTPQMTSAYASVAEEQGIEVIIAGAGGAAHLAGVVAAHTTLPVIGVPLASSDLDGLDALLSTAQMPPGVPVATVAIGKGGARNAGLLAVSILALSDRRLASKLTRFRQRLAAGVEARSRKVPGTLRKLLAETPSKG